MAAMELEDLGDYLPKRSCFGLENVFRRPDDDIFSSPNEGDELRVNFQDIYCRVQWEFKYHGDGTFRTTEGLYGQGSWRKGVLNGTIILGDVSRKRLLGIFTLSDGVVQHVYRPELKTRILDLNMSGERYEGDVDVETNSPCGWGTFYDENNHMVYQGFAFGKQQVVYGTKYWNNGVIQYSGMLMNNQKCGKGVFYNRKGQVETDQDAILDQYPIHTFTLRRKSTFFTPLMKKFVLYPSILSYNAECSFHMFPKLTTLVIQSDDGVFRPLKSFALAHLPLLLEFIVCDMQPVLGSSTSPMEEHSEYLRGSVAIQDCPVLRTISIGKHAFQNIDSCIISGILHSIEDFSSCYYLKYYILKE